MAAVRCQICRLSYPEGDIEYFLKCDNTSDYCDLKVCVKCREHPCYKRYINNDIDLSDRQDELVEQYNRQEIAILREWAADVLRQRRLF